MKAIAITIAVAVSGTAISAAYTDAYASRMNGKGSACSDGMNCMAARHKAATSKAKAGTPKPKTVN